MRARDAFTWEQAGLLLYVIKPLFNPTFIATLYFTPYRTENGCQTLTKVRGTGFLV